MNFFYASFLGVKSSDELGINVRVGELLGDLLASVIESSDALGINVDVGELLGDLLGDVVSDVGDTFGCEVGAEFGYDVVDILEAFA